MPTRSLRLQGLAEDLRVFNSIQGNYNRYGCDWDTRCEQHIVWSAAYEFIRQSDRRHNGWGSERDQRAGCVWRASGWEQQRQSHRWQLHRDNAVGTAAVGNLYGVMIEGGTRNTVGVGLDGVGLRNVISGNGVSGVHINGLAVYGNVVAGNYIGTNAAGTVAIGNTTGIRLQDTGSNIIAVTPAPKAT